MTFTNHAGLPNSRKTHAHFAPEESEVFGRLDDLLGPIAEEIVVCFPGFHGLESLLSPLWIARRSLLVALPLGLEKLAEAFSVPPGETAPVEGVLHDGRMKPALVSRRSSAVLAAPTTD